MADSVSSIKDNLKMKRWKRNLNALRSNNQSRTQLLVMSIPKSLEIETGTKLPNTSDKQQVPVFLNGYEMNLTREYQIE